VTDKGGGEGGQLRIPPPAQEDCRDGTTIGRELLIWGEKKPASWTGMKGEVPRQISSSNVAKGDAQ